MKKLSLTMIILMGSYSFLAAEPQLLPDSKLWLVGDSTLHAFSSASSDLNIKMDVSGTGNLFQKIKSGGLQSLVVTVPVKGLKSGKNQLDNNMVKALKGAENPTIVFTFSAYEVNSSTNTGFFPLTAKGELSIAGQTKPVEIDAFVYDETPVRIKGNEEVLMTDYGIKPPSFFGAIRTHNRIVVNFDLVFEEK